MLAVLTMCIRELVWIRPGVAREVDHWRRHAAAIPDPSIRLDALASLHAKRFNVEGAALFAALAPRRNAGLCCGCSWRSRSCSTSSTRSASVRLQTRRRNGRQLHLALRDALDPAASEADYYRHHPGRADGGYIRALVRTCRECSRSLPAYLDVRTLLLEGAERCTVQGLNHDPDPRSPRRRSAALGAAHLPVRPAARAGGSSRRRRAARSGSTRCSPWRPTRPAAGPTPRRSARRTCPGSAPPARCSTATSTRSKTPSNDAHSYLCPLPERARCRRTHARARRALAVRGAPASQRRPAHGDRGGDGGDVPVRRRRARPRASAEPRGSSREQGGC